jgi:hypothetical protein
VGTREKELHAIHDLVLHIRAIETCPIRHESTGINQNISQVSQQLIFKTCFISFFSDSPTNRSDAKTCAPHALLATLLAPHASFILATSAESKVYIVWGFPGYW